MTTQELRFQAIGIMTMLRDETIEETDKENLSIIITILKRMHTIETFKNI